MSREPASRFDSGRGHLTMNTKGMIRMSAMSELNTEIYLRTGFNAWELPKDHPLIVALGF